MSSAVKIMAILNAKEGSQADLEALLRGLVAASRAEPGNLRYDLWRDKDHPGRYVIDELYRDSNAIQTHRETPHFKAYLARINDLADRTALVVTAVDVA